MHVLVTGGAGFIGSHLTDALLRRGDRVTVIDDLSTGRRENLPASPQLNLVVDTVLNRPLVEQLVARSELVFHLASAVGVMLVVEQPVRTIQSIVEGTDSVLTAARKHRKRTLVTSSSEVYGKGMKVPFRESDDTVLGPTHARRWAYACAKMLDEFLALSHHHEAQLPVTCVRLFNTVGPRQTGRYGMVLPRFVRQALTGQPVTVFGQGEQTRCFCHVSDVVRGLLDLADCSASLGRVVNLGSDHEVSMNALAQRVIELTGSCSTITHIAYEQAYEAGFEDLQRRVPDLTLIRSWISFRPDCALDAIIQDVITHERAIPG